VKRKPRSAEPHTVQGYLGVGDVVASEGIGPSDADLRYLRLAHFDFVIWDEPSLPGCQYSPVMDPGRPDRAGPGSSRGFKLI
jgi:hypothetical protein